MKPPKIIYLVQPYQNTTVYEWCENPVFSNSASSGKTAVRYIRADHVLDVLRESEKVKELIDYLGKDGE